MPEHYPSPFIDDGYTKEAYVTKRHNMWPDVRISYRPLLPMQSIQFSKLLGRLAGSSRDSEDTREQTVQAEMLARQLVEWDVRNRKGDAVPIKPANILRLEPLLMMRMVGIVMGEEGGDVDPHRTPEETVNDYEGELNAMLTRTPLVDLEVKN